MEAFFLSAMRELILCTVASKAQVEAASRWADDETFLSGKCDGLGRGRVLGWLAPLPLSLSLSLSLLLRLSFADYQRV